MINKIKAPSTLSLILLFLIFNILPIQGKMKYDPKKIKPKTTQFQLLANFTGKSPQKGPPGVEVCLMGTNLGTTQGTKKVKMESPNVSLTTLNVVNWQNAWINVDIPLNKAKGVYNLFITNQNNLKISNKISFEVLEKPHITSIEPDRGPVATEVTLHGNHFGASSLGGKLKVWMKNVGYGACQIKTWTNTWIKAVIRSTNVERGAYKICIKQKSGKPDLSNEVNFFVMPIIDRVLPDQGPMRAGIKLIIYGKGFYDNQGNQKVKIWKQALNYTLGVTFWHKEQIHTRLNDNPPPGTYRIAIYEGDALVSNSKFITITGN